MRGCFITGTDTAVGKTVLTAAITSALRARGVDAIACKPVVTGLDTPADPVWPPDHVLLARVSDSAPELVSAITFGPPVSPHLAAELARRQVRSQQLLDGVRSAAASREVVIVEGVGGLRVPLAQDYDVRDLARDLGLPVVIAARPGLGTINHALLTLEAARAGGLEVVAVVLTPWPETPDRLQRSNRETVERLGLVDVRTLPHVERPEPELLAAAAGGLPLEQWLAA
ncbi:MAG: dethiobiotin synthase [Actinomycetota bacterium]|nr:dethiobiotin synthase [Actinomycetota bacterium]